MRTPVEPTTQGNVATGASRRVTDVPMSRARAHLASGRLMQAVGAFRVVVGLNPAMAAGHLGLADALSAMGRREEAIEGLIQTAQTVADEEEYLLAMRLLGKALALDPARSELNIDMAIIEEAMGRRPAAIRRVEALAKTYARQGRTEEADELQRFIMAWEDEDEDEDEDEQTNGADDVDADELVFELDCEALALGPPIPLPPIEQPSPRPEPKPAAKAKVVIARAPRPSESTRRRPAVRKPAPPKTNRLRAEARKPADSSPGEDSAITAVRAVERPIDDQKTVARAVKAPSVVRETAAGDARGARVPGRSTTTRSGGSGPRSTRAPRPDERGRPSASPSEAPKSAPATPHRRAGAPARVERSGDSAQRRAPRPPAPKPSTERSGARASGPSKAAPPVRVIRRMPPTTAWVGEDDVTLRFRRPKSLEETTVWARSRASAESVAE